MTLPKIDALRPSRRTVLKTIGASVGGLAGMAGSVSARGSRKGGGENLSNTPGNYALFWSNENGVEWPLDPDTGLDLDEAFFGGPTTGVFLADEIRITPNRRTLHHNLAPFVGFLMVDKPKPYTLVNQGGDLFGSRGQTVNFTAREASEMKAMLEEVSDSETADELVSNPPLSTLAGKRWRAVATEDVKIVEDELDWSWAATRVDFYSRGGGPMEYTLSFLYALGSVEPDLNKNFASAISRAVELASDGPLNRGGK